MDKADEERSVKTAYTTDGIHLLRTAQTIQYQLSQMADTKANMLLGITFVIFTISLGQVRQIEHPLPLMILGGAAFCAALLAVYAVLPAVSAPPRPHGVANILFFGSFTQLPEDEFVERVMAITSTHKDIYEAMAHDIYQNGQVLARKKYRFLSYAYRVLIAGLIGSFLAFVIQYGLHLGRF